VKAGVDAIMIDDRDNVAVVLDFKTVGSTASVEIGGRIETVKLVSEIPKGHKFALRDMKKGDVVIKYGQPIGQSTATIARGEHVHTHNVESQPRGERR
jgi:altronate dehydratase small subunit